MPQAIIHTPNVELYNTMCCRPSGGSIIFCSRAASRYTVKQGQWCGIGILGRTGSPPCLGLASKQAPLDCEHLQTALLGSALLPNALEWFSSPQNLFAYADWTTCLGFCYPNVFSSAGNVRTAGVSCSPVCSQSWGLSSRTASRPVHRLGEGSAPQPGSNASGVPCERRFNARPRGRPYFIYQELFANKLHACPPFYSQEQLSKIWKVRASSAAAAVSAHRSLVPKNGLSQSYVPAINWSQELATCRRYSLSRQMRYASNTRQLWQSDCGLC